MKKIKCIFGFHVWKNINKERSITTNDTYMVSDLHDCIHCKKQEYKGMGIYL